MTLTIKPAAWVVTGSPQYVDRMRLEVGQVRQLAVAGRRLREPLHRVDSSSTAPIGGMLWP
ncbi:hypothetical protein P3T23_009258 [Paraburkholderia sp. GAS448]|jgi:hypothetical protein|uniref:hypothetical protein n=1 Tax=Paraburkholderia sp. GAS448 TaxID=3035136 RepID=UPI003D226E89